MTLPEYWGEENVGGMAGLLFMVRLSDLPVPWHGRRLADYRYGGNPGTGFTEGFSGSERKFSLRLRNCEFNSRVETFSLIPG